MNRNTAILGTLAGIGTGAAVMYFLDPDRGARRRALVRDQVNSKALKASKAISATKEDLKNRGYGMAMEAKGLVGLSGSDEVDEERFARSDKKPENSRLRKLNAAIDAGGGSDLLPAFSS